jgi:hypothetical protein
MLRQSLIYLFLSILIVVFAKYANTLLVFINIFFTEINLKLTPIFSQTGWGVVIRKILVLMVIPMIITAVPALIYRGIKGREMPHFIAITWIIWTIIVISNILMR